MHPCIMYTLLTDKDRIDCKCRFQHTRIKGRQRNESCFQS